MPEDCDKCVSAITKGISVRSCPRPAYGYILNWTPEKRPICKRHWERIKKNPFSRLLKFEAIPQEATNE